MTTETGVNRVVVGVDGSEAAGDAIKFALKLARASGAELIPVFALAPLNYADYAGIVLLSPIAYDPKVEAELKEAFTQTWCRPFADSGLPYRPIFAEGRPATVIAAVAEAEGADLVVVGRRGRGSVGELLLGSVSQELAHHCSTPVVLVSHVKAAAREQVEAAAAARS